jgi:hypothetical protein
VRWSTDVLSFAAIDAHQMTQCCIHKLCNKSGKSTVCARVGRTRLSILDPPPRFLDSRTAPADPSPRRPERTTVNHHRGQRSLRTRGELTPGHRIIIAGSAVSGPEKSSRQDINSYQETPICVRDWRDHESIDMSRIQLFDILGGAHLP